MTMKIKGFDNLDEFLRYCDVHSQTPRALFNIDHVNALYGMAGYFSLEVLDKYQVVAIHEAEMQHFLDIIKRRRNSIECVCEEIPTAENKAPGNVFRLDDYR